MDKTIKTSLQGKIFDLALFELVKNHRETFEPLWTTDSWVKFLIFLTLQCGLSGERESLEIFVEALGPRLATIMRRNFFERILENPSLKLIGEPADKEVLIMPRQIDQEISFKEAEQAIFDVGLAGLINSNKHDWKKLDALIAIPWKA